MSANKDGKGTKEETVETDDGPVDDVIDIEDGPVEKAIPSDAELKETAQIVKPGGSVKCPKCVANGQRATDVQKLATREGTKQYYVCKRCVRDDNPLRAFSFAVVFEQQNKMPDKRRRPSARG